MGEILSESREIGHKGDTAKKITVKLWGKGVFEKKEVGSAATQYYVRHTNQFIYSKLDFLNSAFGVIPKKLDCFESTADLPAFDCNDINPYFLYYRVTQPDFYFKNGMIADGSRKAKRIHSRVFLNMELIFPNEREQQNVVKLLQSLDHLITLHQSKRFEYIFVDVACHTLSWEQRKLGEVADKVIEKNVGLQYIETFTNSAEFGIISQRDFFDHDIAKMSSLGGYYIVRSKDFVYNPRISTSAPVGPINSNKLGRIGVMSPLYTVFRPHDIDTTYLEDFFKSRYWHLFMNFNGDSGARSDRFSIKDSIFFEMPIPIPHIDEQRRIGEYLTHLDHLITLHQRKLEKLKIIKKSMLENLFPKNGEKTPRIRFSGFTEDWEQRKLGEVAAFSKGCGYSKSDLKDSGVPVILYGRLYTNYETVIKEVDTFIDSIGGAVYSKGGEIITPSSGETSEDISIASVVEKSGILLGGDLNIIYPQNFLDSIFIAISISNGKPHKDMAKRTQGKSVVHLHNGDLAQIEIDYPSIYEQTRISSYFQSLDHLITLHQLEPYYLIFKAIAYRIIDYAEYKPF